MVHQQTDGELFGDEIPHLFAETARFLICLPHDGRDAGKNLDFLRITAETHGTLANILAECTTRRNIRLQSKDYVSRSRRQFSSGFGRASLKDHRSDLRTSVHGEWAAYFEELPFMLQKVHFCDIEINAVFLVADDSALLPAFP